jgi:hypothetical protein
MPRPRKTTDQDDATDAEIDAAAAALIAGTDVAADAAPEQDAPAHVESAPFDPSCSACATESREPIVSVPGASVCPTCYAIARTSVAAAATAVQPASVPADPTRLAKHYVVTRNFKIAIDGVMFAASRGDIIEDPFTARRLLENDAALEAVYA